MKLFIKYRITLCCILLISGIVSADNLQPGIFTIIALSLSVVVISAFRKNWLILLFLPLGMAVTPVFSPSPLLIKFENKKIVINGTLLKNPEIRPDSTRLFLGINSISYGAATHEAKGKIVLYSTFPLSDFSSGDMLEIDGMKLKKIKSFKNPGVFDIAKYYSRQNIFHSGFVNDVKDISYIGPDPDFSSLLRLIDRERLEFVNFVRGNIPKPESEIINALSVGVKSSIPDELRERFSALGISHVFAISGLHIGAVAFIFYRIIKWLLKRSEYILLMYQVQKISAALTILPVATYTAIAGFSTSSVRASIMVSTYLLSLVAGREEYRVNSLAIAAMLILLTDPHSLYDLSFKLSFLAVLGILFVHSLYPFRFGTLQEKANSSLKATTAATFCTLPVTINSFGYLPVSTLPANLLVVPVIEIAVMPLAVLSVMFFRISESLTTLVLGLNELAISSLLWFTSLFDRAGLTYYTFPDLGIASTVLFFISGISLLYPGNRKIPACILTFSLTVIVLNQFVQNPFRDNGILKLSYYDAGNKNVSLVELPYENRMLINGGHSPRSRSAFIEEAVIIPHLLSQKILKLDYLIVTSTDRSHINGLKSLLKRIKVDNLWTNGARLDGELWQIIHEKGIRWKDISSHTESFTLEGVEFSFIKPRGEFSVWDYRKPLPLIIRISYRNNRFLMGELLENRFVQKELVITYRNRIESDVIYLPDLSVNDDLNSFLDTTQAEYIICKRCTVPEKGGNRKVGTLETGVLGMVTVKTDGERIITFKQTDHTHIQK